MKVLFITGAFPPMKCGVGDYTSLLVANLASIPGVVPGVITAVAAAKCPEPPYYFYPVMERWNCLSIGKIVESLKQFRPDIVHLQYPSSFGRVFLPNFLPLICAAIKIPMVQTWHEAPIYSQLINAIPADTLVVVEPGYPAAYRWPYRLAVRHKRCACIPIGANIPRMKLTPEKRRVLRKRYGAEAARLIVYFGFAQPFKGVESLFRIADPALDRLVLICDLNQGDSYHDALRRQIEDSPWRGKSYVTGYQPAEEAAALLAAADVAVFPFVGGATPRNGSILAARLQGTLVVTTHAKRRGYDPFEHTVYTAPGDEAAMTVALDLCREARAEGIPAVATWEEIAGMHRDLYERVLCCRGKEKTLGDGIKVIVE